MNIFFLDKDPILAAQYQVDKHVVKMCVETAQLLSTAHRVIDGDEKYSLPDQRDSVLYKPSHINHPCAVWVRESVKNYIWAVEHFHALLDEYAYRYNKEHKSGNLVLYCDTPPHKLKQYESTPIRLCVPEKYRKRRILSPVQCYRAYYIHEKAHIHSWKNRNPPDWINDVELNTAIDDSSKLQIQGD